MGPTLEWVGEDAALFQNRLFERRAVLLGPTQLGNKDNCNSQLKGLVR